MALHDPHSTPSARPAPVAIYDRRDDVRVRGLGCLERVAACYRWASARGHLVLGQYVDWNEPAVVPASLAHALEECAAHGASLLIYAAECIGAEPERLDAITQRLDGRPVLFVVDAVEQPAGRAA